MTVETQPPRMQWPEAKARLVAELPALLRAWCPGLKAHGGHWTAPNPTRTHDNAGSFVIWANGAWKEYDAGDEERGDAVDLLIYLAIDGVTDRTKALAWLRARYEGGRDAASQVTARREVPAARPIDDDRRQAAARRLWFSGRPVAPGDPPWRYLKARGIDPVRLGRWPSIIRWLPSLDHIDEDGEITSWPVMLTAMIGAKGVAAVHRTWLAPDGAGKAPVRPAKKMMGAARGAVMPLTRGAAGLSPSAAAKAGALAPVVITEGIEDALTVSLARPDLRCWAAGSLAQLAGMAWPPCASGLILVADNDWAEGPAAAAFAKARARLSGLGPVTVARPSIAWKDFNEAAMAAMERKAG